MMRVVTIVGARPQFIKAAVVSRVIREAQLMQPNSISECIVHTGQHFDQNMSNVFFNELDIPKPDHHLGIGGGTHGQNTGRMIESIERVLMSEKPDWVLVYGDTDSTLAGAVAAVKIHVPVAHVEAGLRSFNRRMPEEINRILTDHSSNLLFAPTDLAVTNLVKEGIDPSNIKQVGDVMYDAALYYAQRATQSSDILNRLKLETKTYVLATIHRAENTDDVNRLSQILSGMASAGLPVVLPIHPRFRKRLSDFGLSISNNVHVIEPLGYLDMVMLESHAAVILTDSGGVQKEAYFHRVPCITMRDETEWVETIQAGWNTLVGADAHRIESALQSVRRPADVNLALYGRGDSGQHIIQQLIEHTVIPQV